MAELPLVVQGRAAQKTSKTRCEKVYGDTLPIYGRISKVKAISEFLWGELPYEVSWAEIHQDFATLEAHKGEKSGALITNCFKGDVRQFTYWRTVSLKLLQGKEPHVTRKPNAVQYSRDPKDYQNVDGSSRLQQLNSTLKIQGCAKFLEWNLDVVTQGCHIYF